MALIPCILIHLLIVERLNPNKAPIFGALKLRCGKCKKYDNLKLIDIEALLYQCDKCGALNRPDKAGEKYFIKVNEKLSKVRI
ncbi:MAG: hypothetical protein ACTSPS_14085 [Promethearchaeota archaeon]